jgi:hypothetical protein
MCRAVAMLMAAVAAHVWLVRAPQRYVETVRETDTRAVQPAPAPSTSEPNIQLDTRTIVIPPAPVMTLRKARRTDAAEAVALQSRPSTLQSRPPTADSEVVDVAIGTAGTPAAQQDAAPAAGPSLPPAPSRETENVQTFASVAPALTPAPQPAVAGRVAAGMTPSAAANPAGEDARTPQAAAARRPDPAAELQKQEQVVRELLERYAYAYERMDVQAAKALHPSLNDRELRRLFKGLNAQQVRLAGCDLSIVGQGANARCQRSATYRTKVGSQVLRYTNEWTFNLSRDDAGWQIVDARIQ